MTLEEVEQEIANHYRFFHITAPGVRLREEGRLAQLWRYVDFYASDDVD